MKRFRVAAAADQQYIQITHLSQLVHQPMELPPQRDDRLGVQERTGGSEVGAQPPDPDSGLVNALDVLIQDDGGDVIDQAGRGTHQRRGQQLARGRPGTQHRSRQVPRCQGRRPQCPHDRAPRLAAV
ncbi:MAG TPA: hypothetical protein VMU90_09970, partial [Solirubrobacteraceae bacterium]|nr:hypothetical protein [Solirubrobacteraceae bacterium]